MGQDCCSNREKTEKDANGNIVGGGNPNEAAKNGSNASYKEKLGQVGTAMKNYDYKTAADSVKNYDYKKAAESTKQAVVNYDYKKAATQTQEQLKNYDYKGTAVAVKSYDYKGAYEQARNSEYTQNTISVLGKLKTQIQAKVDD